MWNQRILFTALVSAGMVMAGSTWQKSDPSQWTSEDVYQILNSSPWSKAVKVTVARSAGYGGDGSGGGGGNGGVWGEGPGGGGMGRGGMGGGGMGRGRRGGGYPQQQQGPTVTVQWASALPVRLAEAKLDGAAGDAAAMKVSNEYVIAVIGLPKTGFGAKASGDSGNDSDDEGLADHLKVITVLSFGNQRLNPTKVELNQGRDGRAVFRFEKQEPITAQDKDAEFRITSDRMEIKKKFALKDMEYQGKLEL